MKLKKLLLPIAAMVGFSFTANAGSIGVNTGPDTVGDGTVPEHAQNNVVPPTSTAGVVPQTNWNNVMQTSGWGTQQVTDDSGTLLATTVSVQTSWGNGNVILHGTPDAADGDRLMMNGGMDNGGGFQGWTITGIPYATYDVYIYYDGGSDGSRGGSYQVWDSDNSDAVLAAQSGYDTATFDGTYIQATGDGTDGMGQGLDTNYVVLTGLTAPNIKIRSLADQLGGGDAVKRAPMNGFQIVEPGGGGVTSLSLAIATAISPDTGFDLTWPSQSGMLYNVWSTADLSEALVDWDLVEGDIAADGSGTNIKNVTPGEAVLFYRLEEFPAPPLFSENFEDDNGGFSTTGTPNDWDWGTPNSNNDAGLVLTTGAGSSEKCWGTNLGDGVGVPRGVIDIAANSILRSPNIDLTGISGAQLEFAAAVDAVGGDILEVLIREVGTDNQLGATIVPVTAPATANWADLGPFDLSAADNTNVYLEFRFQGTDATYIGFYIDDITITQP